MRRSSVNIASLCSVLLLCSTGNAIPHAVNSVIDSLRSLAHQSKLTLPTILHMPGKRDATNTTTTNSTTTNSTNSTNSLWLPQDTYQGSTFFDTWDFFTGPDPTNGLVDFVNQTTAFAQNLAYVTSDGTVIMQGDNTTTLPAGQNRASVRIQSQKTYTGGLFILDLNMAPWGCGVWPAFWSLGANVTWPDAGEIDIIEGVHDNVHNQVTWHTLEGCNLTTPGNFTGSPVGQTDCNALINSNAGCGITDWSRVSYGEQFDAQGGGVYAMKWDEDGIAVWYFYRVSIPQDILDERPDPTSWTTPSAQLASDGCDPFKYFNNHQLVFDITFCGDWAGNTYATTPGCTGTCPDHLMDPANFVNASWSINSLKVYRKQSILGTVTADAQHRRGSLHYSMILWVVSLCVLTLIPT